MTEQDEIVFQEAMGVNILHHGGGRVATQADSKEYLIETKVGLLHISLHKPTGNMYSMFCRFENIAQAATKFDCNPHSGKFNFHISDYAGRTVHEAIQLATNHITKTL